MDFDPRWTDDPRERDDYGLRAEALAKAGRELSQGSRGGLSNPRERERLDATCSRATSSYREAMSVNASGRETAT